MKQMKKNYDLAEIEIIRFEAHDVITGSGEQGGSSGGYDGPGGIIDPDWDTN